MKHLEHYPVIRAIAFIQFNPGISLSRITYSIRRFNAKGQRSNTEMVKVHMSSHFYYDCTRNILLFYVSTYLTIYYAFIVPWLQPTWGCAQIYILMRRIYAYALYAIPGNTPSVLLRLTEKSWTSRLSWVEMRWDEAERGVMRLEYIEHFVCDVYLRVGVGLVEP